VTTAARIRRSVCCAACVVCAAQGVEAQGPRLEPTGVRRVEGAAERVLPAGMIPSELRAPEGGNPRNLSQVGPAEESRGTPPVEPARVAGQVLAGAYSGIGGYVLASWAGGLAMNNMPASENTKDQIQFALGLVGATMATAASVSAIGNIGDQTGSYRAALAGTAGGVAVGVILNQLLYGHARLPSEEGSSRVRWIEASLEALLPSIGATLAFNSTRKYK
jgi:hypothetical protein